MRIGNPSEKERISQSNSDINSSVVFLVPFTETADLYVA